MLQDDSIWKSEGPTRVKTLLNRPCSPCSVKFAHCGKDYGLQPAWAALQSLQKALEGDQATSGSGRIAYRWRQTSQSLGPFIDLPPGSKLKEADP